MTERKNARSLSWARLPVVHPQNGDAMKSLRALWRGEMPLADAFWIWTVTVGLAVNLVTSALFVALMTNDRVFEALVAGYVPSLPYNLVASVGLLRAAARYDGPALNADLARGAGLLLMAVLSFT